MYIDEKRAKILILICLIICAVVFLVSFGKRNEGRTEVTTLSAEKESLMKESLEASTEVAVVVDDFSVYLDEVTYYAMTTQATYETYYIANGTELDWNSMVDEGVTLETAVKSKLLDDICRRESLIYQANNNELGSELNVVLTESEKSEVTEKTEKYFEETSKKLIDRIGISKERLEYVFTREAMYDKILAEAQEAGIDTEQAYEKWKKEKSVATLDAWDRLKFDQPIFTKDDLKED